ncbi:flagellar basal body rod protein FlgB [Rhizobium sp. XQZ8]|uniref:flagellar basal body rod protein FlgB n=1 Tax=Rhizobium populisoli TaxID=2859785 RepID=UPI001CA5D90B|nr:flagellar basal body rod protein FlgB [Rhizobium populisoli]MBW6420714.1 flagellar basal body rod protein FlgB [Rhizobium populisoli]
MQEIQLFALASRQADWLSVRQEVVAGNIANANTPKFKAKDVTPFNAVLDQTQHMAMARTHAGHMASNDLSDEVDIKESALNDEIGVQESGNTVSLSQELSKTGEIKRQYELSTGLVKSFHSMMLMTVKR